MATPIPLITTTPRREPPDVARLPLPPAASALVRTPGSQAQQQRFAALPQHHQGAVPPSTGRRPHGGGVLVPIGPSATATPHGRAARRAIDSRRAAFLTPHRRNRRRSQREARETPRVILQGLARVLASKSQPIHTSSSSSPGGSNDDIAGGGSTRRRSGRPAGRNDESSEDELGDLSFISRRARHDDENEDDDDDDDDDEDLPKRPRLSLPLADDEGADSDSDLVPHQSAGLEDQDDDFTRQSVEFARRYAFQDARLSLGGRHSDFHINFNPDQDDQNDTNMDVMALADPEIDSGFFPPQFGDASAYRLDSDPNEPTMGILDSPERPGAAGEGTTIDMSPHRLGSPTHEVQDFDGPIMFPDNVNDDVDVDDENMGYPPLDDGGFGNDDDDDNYEDEDSFGAADVATTTGFATARAATPANAAIQGKRAISRNKPTIRKSRHGLEYSTVPPKLVKRAALQFASSSGTKGRIAPDVLQALSTASDWFFEQLGEDLGAYAKHANRKTIDESDVRMLMKRQRLLNSSTSVFSLAQKYLPRELIQDMRMVPPVPAKTRRKKNRTAAVADSEVN